MVLAQANRKHRYVSSPPNECVNIVALILYAVSALLFSLLSRFGMAGMRQDGGWFVQMVANNEPTINWANLSSAKLMIEKLTKKIT